MTTAHLERQDRVLEDVAGERDRQDYLKIVGKFPATLADPGLTPSDRLTVLAEEFGEVANAVAESLTGKGALDVVALREELIQVAACAVAWVEFLDAERERRNAPTLLPYPARVLDDGLAPAPEGRVYG